MYPKKFVIFIICLTSTFGQDVKLNVNEFVYKTLTYLPWINGTEFELLWDIMSLSYNDVKVQLEDFESCDENNQYYPEVSHPEFGVAKGRMIKSFNGREFSAFHSIPYAMPITPNNRFSMTKNWEGKWSTDGSTFDASFIRVKCPQISLLIGTPTGREDCLHLNIYTPDTGKKFPVMFFIHGGAFLSGDATLYIPTKMLDRDVVVVVIQYRLGTLGFLASGREENPGNMGLMDQIIALQWVQKHISYFGGDSDLITVFGQSAGAASASWLQLSPLIADDPNPPIHRIILQSGSALEIWAHDPNPQDSFELQARQVNCWKATDGDAVGEALKCMKEKSVEEIVQGFYDVSINDQFSAGLGFKGSCPVIQKDFLAQNPDLSSLVVIPDDAFNLITNQRFLKVPLIVGAVREEGSLVLGLIYKNFLEPRGLINNTYFLSHGTVPLLTTTFGINDVTGSVAHSLKIAFLQYAEMGNWDSMTGGLVDMTGMMFLKSGAWSLSHLLTKFKLDLPIFFYSFEFESDDSLFNWTFLMDPEIPISGGVCHTDDLLYLFYLPALMVGDQDQITTVNRITQLWSNFAKYGDPTPEGEDQDNTWMGDVPRWEPFSFKGENFMLMTRNFTIGSDFTTRWRPNTIMDLSSNRATRVHPEIKTEAAMKSEEEAEDSTPRGEEETWKLAVGVTGAACVFLALSTLGLLLGTGRL